MWDTVPIKYEILRVATAALEMHKIEFSQKNTWDISATPHSDYFIVQSVIFLLWVNSALDKSRQEPKLSLFWILGKRHECHKSRDKKTTSNRIASFCANYTS